MLMRSPSVKHIEFIRLRSPKAVNQFIDDINA